MKFVSLPVLRSFSFFFDPKAWISHLVKLVDIDSLPMSFDSEKSHPLIDW